MIMMISPVKSKKEASKEKQQNRVKSGNEEPSATSTSPQDTEQQLAQTFNEKYGQGQLDPKTGIFTPAPKQEEAPAEDK